MKRQRCESEQFTENSDKLERFARDFYIKWKEGESQQDSGREAEHCVEREIVSAIK